MEKIKHILSKLTFKQYLGIGVGVIVLYLGYSFVFKTGMFTESEGIDLIPRNTVAVGVVSIGDIIDKADVKNLLKLDLDIIEDLFDNYEDLQEEAEDESDLAASILDDPEDIGIDIKQDIFIYGVLEDIEEEEVYICVSGGVDDNARLLEILEEIEDEANLFEIDEEDNYHIALTKGGRDVMAFAWDDDKFLYITNPQRFRWSEDDIDDLEDEVERLFNLKSKEKLTSISSFDDFYDNKTDLCAWASPEGLDLDFLPGLSKMALTVIGLKEKDLKECSASVFCDFGNGDVSIKAGFYPSEGLQEELEERSQISTSELSFELTMKFDDSGDNTIHVLLRSILTIANELGLDKMMRGGFVGGFDTSESYDRPAKKDPYYYDDYGSGSGPGNSGSARGSDYY